MTVGWGISRRWRCAILSASFLLSCSQDRVSGGNSSETPNTLAGRLVDASGRARAGDTVRIRPADWTSDDMPPEGVDRNWIALSDADGRYRFEGVASGSYVLEARGASGGYLSEAVSMGRERPAFDLGDDTIHPYLEVEGRVVVDSSRIGDSALAQVCGTDHRARIDRSGAFRLTGIPAGRIRLRAILGATAGGVDDEFRLPPEGLISPRLLSPSRFEDEDYSKWPRSRTARIRFSGKGWYLDSDQPSAPIRVVLTDSVLAGPWEPTGAGLRFSDSSGGSRFPYQIESWDPVGRRAEVWVRLDMANKGSDGHFLKVFWGRTDATDRSDGARVFDTAQGWVGVWHLSGPDPWKDATANRLRLAPTLATPARGAISGGVVLVPGSRLVAEGAVLQGWQDAGASLWAKVDSARPGANLARFGDRTDSDSSDWRLGLSDSGGLVSCRFSTASQIAIGGGLTDRLSRGAWHSVGGAFSRNTPRVRLVRDDSAQALFVRDSFAARANPVAFVVGGGFSGVVDEIRLRRTTVHPDLLRMQWGSDRDGSPVLEWIP